MKHVLLTLFTFVLVAKPVVAVDLNDYRRDVDIYRTDYAAYEVKKGAYTLNQTFAAEEELITSARTMLLSRADVWISYWQLLKTQIAGLINLSKTNRDTISENLTTEVVMLGRHKERLVTLKTRADLLEEAQIVNAQWEAYQSLAFSVNTELVTNRMLQATQSLLKFNADLTGRVKEQQLMATEKASKLRGLTVNGERIDQIVNKLMAARNKFTENRMYASGESFSKITGEVGPLYPELNLQLQTIIELSKGVEW